MKRFLTASMALNIALLLFVVLQRECYRPKPKISIRADTVEVVKYTIRHDTVKSSNSISRPYPDTVYLSYIPIVNDSTALIEYNKVKIYHRNLWDDVMAKIVLTDTIFRNNLLGFHLDAEFFRHDTTRYVTKFITTLSDPTRTKVFVGFQAGIYLPNKIIAAPTLAILTKKEHLYSLAYDPFNKAATVGILWKIRLKKPP